VLRDINRISLKANAQRVSARDRPSIEIDVRSQSTGRILDAEAMVRTRSKTYLGVRASQRTITFERDATFFGVNLARELNRTTTSKGIVVRNELTALTSLTLDVARDADRFMLNTLRNGDSTRISFGVGLRPQALISGGASVGYRRLTPVSPEIPPYRGPIASINLSYTLRGSTSFTFVLLRDMQHAFNPGQPYYLQTLSGFSVRQQITGPFDAQIRFENITLAFRDRVGAIVQVSNRVDHHYTTGVGVGYRLGQDKRVGFILDRRRRTSR
jgi:hypothetical protein